MNKTYLIGVLIIVFSLIEIASSFNQENIIELEKGKNHLFLNLSKDISVKDFVLSNPKIVVISFKEQNKTIGYINVGNGIGPNFLLENREYEIIVNDRIKLNLPNN